MKIAVPTNDGVSISRHFGRSAAFLVFDVQDKSITSRESRSNAGCHSHGSADSHGDTCNHGEGSHGGILSVLGDCEVVICSGIGGGASQALNARGVKTILADPGPAEETVVAWLAGTLAENTASACNCHH